MSMLDPSSWSFERLLWLVPVLFAIHNAEEAPQMERGGRTGSRLVRARKSGA